MAEKKPKDFYVLDIEVYRNLFFVGCRDYRTKRNYTFEISPRKDQRKELYEWLTNYNGFLVTFNGLHYDEVVLKYFMKQYYEEFASTSVSNLTFWIKQMSDKIVREDYESYKEYKWFKTGWTSIDLFCYWSRGLRISKHISLKALAVQMNYDEIQELPFSPDHVFQNEEEVEHLIRYNMRNDLGVLSLLYQKMRGDVELRQYLLKEYKITCWSMDAPKIASEYLLEDYCRKTYDENCGKPYWQYKKDVHNRRYTPTSFRVGDYIPKVNFKTPFFKKIYDDFCNKIVNPFEKKEDKKKKEKDSGIPFIHKTTSFRIVPSVGGIHSVNDNQIWESDKDYVIVDADIASLYPTLFIEYGFLRGDLKIVLDKYLEIKEDRIEAKHTGNKKKDKFLKLVLNSELNAA